MWIIKRIDEADYGCEERLPGEPLVVSVLLENEYLETARLEVADQWLTMQELDEGDEWPDEIDAPGEKQDRVTAQNAWLESFLEDMEQLEEGKQE